MDPKSLRREMLHKANTGHMGKEKCRQRARRVMYWPGMNQSIEEKVKSCSECLCSLLGKTRHVLATSFIEQVK